MRASSCLLAPCKSGHAGFEPDWMPMCLKTNPNANLPVHLEPVSVQYCSTVSDVDLMAITSILQLLHSAFLLSPSRKGGAQPQLAMQVYLDDLATYPENGWSLHGFSDVLHRLGRNAELKALRPQLEAAWKHAEVAVDSSCLVFSRTWGTPPPV